MPCFAATAKACHAMSSTVAGQRRILKRHGSVVDYIRQAVETGVYRTADELSILRKERNLNGTDDLRVIMQRFRQDIVRGSFVHDYPTEYLILEQHPPLPDPPRTPVKFLKQLAAPPNPVERLTKQYLQRQSGGRGGASNHITTEEYYRRLLGVQAAAASASATSMHGRHADSSLRHKPASVQRAYAAAVTHYQLQRTEGLSDADAVRRVDELLASHAVHEQTTSHARTGTVQAHSKSAVAPPPPATTPGADFPFLGGSNSMPNHANDNTGWDSIFSDDPRTVQGMMRWSERLQAVPYLEWTIGASTALDHWIARQVLGVSEETWQSTLQGDDANLLSIGRDIVACREALFPETNVMNEHTQEAKSFAEQDAMAEQASLENERHETETKSIEELLRKLGGLRGPDATAASSHKPNDDWSFLAQAEQDAAEEHSDLDTKVDKLVHELQSWRRRNVETPYDSWSKTDQDRFVAWMKQYVQTVSSGAERNRRIDYESTRVALLSQPPVTADDSDTFWSQLTDQSSVTALLDAMTLDGPPPGATLLQASFWDLPRSQQVSCLVNLGAVRPLLDEYTKESDRLRFLQRHGDTILAGVPLEHLVVDPHGPVRAIDLQPDVILALGIPEGARFRLELLPYQSSAGSDNAPTAATETSRALFLAWNEHKAGRARYEEKLFQTGRLGLRYRDKVVDPDAQK